MVSIRIVCPICDDRFKPEEKRSINYVIGHASIPVVVCQECYGFMVKDACRKLKTSTFASAIRLLRGKEDL